MKKLLTILLGLTFFTNVAYATIGLAPTYPLNNFLTGNTTNIITSTSTPFFSSFTFGNATGTNATTTSLFSTKGNFTNLCVSGDCKTSWPAAITALTGDVTASGPGSVVSTLATVNLNVGSFGGTNSIPSFTVNGKGLITAAAGNTPSIPASEITAGTFGTGNYIFNGNASTTQLGSTGSAYFATSGGNVGIGTTSPATSGNTATFFTVSGEAGGAGRLGEIGVSANQTSTAGFIGGYSFANGALSTTDKRIAAIYSETTGATNSGDIELYTANAGTLSERVRIDKSGNVGIGTTNPTYALDIQPTPVAANAHGAIPLRITGQTGATTDNVQMRFAGQKDGELWAIGSDISLGGSTGDFEFYNLGNAGATQGPKVTILGNGSVGIGVTNPSQPLSISSAFTDGVLSLAQTGSTNYTDIKYIGTGRTWYAGVGNGSETGISVANKFFIYDNGAAAVRMAINTSGALQLNAYGAGTLTTDASGNVTASSDERLKNIQGNFSEGLSAILGLKPILYKWNAASGLDRTTVYAGFSAQNVQAFIPEAVDTDSRGYLTLQDRPIEAALVNSVKELTGRLVAQQKEIEELQNEIKNLEK